MSKSFARILLSAALIFTLNGLVCCLPSFCSNDSGCHSQAPCPECCCFTSADNLNAIASANPSSTDLSFTADTTSTPVVATVKVAAVKDRGICFKEPRLLSKLNECKLFKMFVSRKDFV
jgi:hypothetical protein